MPGRRPEFREGKPAEAVARTVARVVELSSEIAHLHDTGERLREEITSHLRRLDRERQRAGYVASGGTPAHQHSDAPADETSSAG